MSWMNIILISTNLILGYLVYLKMNDRGRHLNLNRWYLIGFPLASIALGMAYHYSEGSVISGFAIELPIVEINASMDASTEISTINWPLWLYSIGMVLSVIQFSWSLWKVRKPQGAKLLNTLGKQRIYLISDKQHSYSLFNSVFISEYQLDNVEFIVEHELAHSRQKHSIDIVLIRLIRCFLWFHPVVYLWESKMKENHEYLADKVCVNDETDVKKYSYALFASYMGVSIPELANGFNKKSLLQKRIIQLKTQNTFNMKKVILIPAVLAGVVLTMSIQLKTSNNETPISQAQKSEITKGEIDSNPEFVGGMSAMITYLQENIKYPKTLANENIEDKVFVKFVVSKSGKIKKVSLAKASEHEAFNDEATRVISNMPDWKPGTKDGKAVSAEMTLPIQFTMAK
ncbi:MAG: M56 family metallopeptidase [Crocinitomicaceae bacterium]|nr:M56 family metallopeptidase [Crocinitomicaceae bacterium]